MTRKKITLTCTGEQKVYHEFSKPFICKPDIDLPKMYNNGWSSFRFIGGEPEFKGINMPEILKLETKNFKHYECKIVVINKNGKETEGFYSKHVNKNTNKVSEIFAFD